MSRPKLINSNGVLRPFGVRPKNLRINGAQGKGYELTDLQEIFSLYVRWRTFYSSVGASSL